MKPTTVTIAGVTLTGFEIPEEIPLGGPLMFKTHRMQGGKRQVDALGADWAPISWSGRFRAPDGMERARALERTKNAGQAVTLTFAELAYTVLIVGFDWRFRGNGEHPYTITLEVISDDASPLGAGQGISATEMITGDFADATSALSPLSRMASPMSSLASAVAGVRDFATAARTQITGVLAPLIIARNQGLTLIADAETALGSVGSLGRVAAGLSGPNLASGLLGQLAAMQSCADLYEGDALFGRMTKNLQAIGSSGAHVIVAGYDLFKMAETHYGDATEWSTLARANKLTDPIGTGITELVVPPLASGAGGVLG